jgi:hypothetical protein
MLRTPLPDDVGRVIEMILRLLYVLHGNLTFNFVRQVQDSLALFEDRRLGILKLDRPLCFADAIPGRSKSFSLCSSRKLAKLVLAKSRAICEACF